MTAETSNARGETYTFDMIEDAWGDAVPLTKPYFNRFRARLETLRQSAAPPPAAEGVQAEPKAEAQLTYKGVPIGPMQTFADIERQASAPVGVDSLVAGCRVLLEQYEASGDFSMGGKLTNRPFLMIRAALNELFGNSEQLPQCRCSDGPYHYPDCPHRDPEWVDPFAALGAAMSGRALAQQPAAVDEAMPILIELVATLAATGTVTGGRIYFPERQTRELLKKACDALAAQHQEPTT